MQDQSSSSAAPWLRDLLGGTFRAHDAYELVEHARLPSDRRQAFAGLGSDPDHYGLLIPRRSPELGVMAVDCDSALLFLSLLEPGPLPAFARSRVQPDCNGSIARWVLDGVLEMECEDGFRTGPGAYRGLFEGEPPAPADGGAVARLSYDAMRWAQVQPIEDPERLSSWLYSYNALPASPAWARRLGRRERLDDALGLSSSGPAREILDTAYVCEDLPSWRSWRLEAGGPRVDIDQPSYKLYVSPHPDALGEAFRTAVRCMVAARVPAFKLGKGVHGMLRPDKLVVYVDEYEALEDLGASLAAKLRGCPAQGVPFTAALSDDGLLSWGMDPPRGDRIPGWSGIESWRIWVTNRLARSILRARGLGSGGLEPWRYALARLAIEGVNVDGWLPAAEIWTEGEVPA